jgi:hypothetical protein
MDTIEEACKIAIETAEPVLAMLERNRPTPQWNWWNSGKCMNEGEMNNWYFTKLDLERGIKKVRENPSYTNARNLVHRACDISAIYDGR